MMVVVVYTGEVVWGDRDNGVAWHSDNGNVSVTGVMKSVRVTAAQNCKYCDRSASSSMTTISVLQGETQNNKHSMANRRGGVGMAVSFGMAYQ